MKRRDFIASAVAAVASVGSASSILQAAPEPRAGRRPGPSRTLPRTIAGKSLDELENDCRDRLFNQYLPFWDRGGFDEEFGGFLCELNDDGSVASDEKYIWYQGRAIWVYSFLYSRLGRDERFLEIARKTKDFMVRHMHAGGGRWNEKVRRDGSLVQGPGPNVYGSLFAAAGLAEFFGATRDPKDLELAKRSIWAAVRAYDDPGYVDTHTTQYTAVKVPPAGVRSQGHSMVLVWMLSGLLAVDDDERLEELQRRHVGLVMDRFWNPDFGIANEYLRHDYSRIPDAASHMFAGHTLETLWMVMHEAIRIKDRALFDTAKRRIRRVIEMCWDYVFEGWSDGNFFVHATDERRRGPEYEVKTMWAHCEILIACTTVLEYTGETWAKEWYERARRYILNTMANTGHGVWRQAVDRYGKDLKRVGVSPKRKGNFHQPRMLMLNILSLKRMIDNAGRLTPFPA